MFNNVKYSVFNDVYRNSRQHKLPSFWMTHLGSSTSLFQYKEETK